MYLFRVKRFIFAALAVGLSLVLIGGHAVMAQSKPQKVEAPSGSGKKNARPVPLSPEEQKKADEEKKRAEEEKNAVVENIVEKIETNIVNVDAVVFNKKT